MDKTVKAAEHGEMKEVKGLGDRLFGLEQLMVETKRYVTEQTDLAQSFQQVCVIILLIFIYCNF